MLCTIKTTAESGAVAELADAGDLKSPGSHHVGSIPTRPTLTIWGNSPLKSPYKSRLSLRIRRLFLLSPYE